MERRQHRVALAGAAVTYLTVGAGPALFVLHPEPEAARGAFVEQLAATHTVYVPHLPGFNAPPYDALTSAELAAAAAAFVEAAIGTVCDVWGHDSGAAVALWLALERPAGVSHVVVTAPADRDVGEGIAPALLDRLAALEQPTLIVQGSADPVVPAANARALRSVMRRAFLTYVWDAGHALDAEQPERLFHLVAEFLERSEAFIVNWGTLAL